MKIRVKIQIFSNSLDLLKYNDSTGNVSLLFIKACSNHTI